MAIDRWDFTEALGEERRRHLDADGSFEAIADGIRDTMEVLCCHKDPCDRAAGFRRVVYCVRVSRSLFDRFFNSRHGYRAAYFRSPFEGLAANAYMLRSLAPKLIAAAPPGDGKELGQEFIEASLTSVSAKLWLTEQNAFCALCEGEWSSGEDGPEIRNGVWEFDASPNGRATPYLTKIKVMGAFLNDRHDEFIPERKRRRHLDIHETGWS